MEKLITIVTSDDCIYCRKAKAIFDQMLIPYKEIDILDANMSFKTVPQIFINLAIENTQHRSGYGRLIGGYTDLMVYLNQLLTDSAV